MRRRALIDATLRSLERHGRDGASIRRISAIAGVSSGLISHHFRNKAKLIAAAYESLAIELQETLYRDSGAGDRSPRERVSAFIRASFAPSILEPRILNVWLVFWSMVMRAPAMRAVHDRTYRRYRSILGKLLQSVGRTRGVRVRARPAAIALSALLDGLWIELCLSPGTFRPTEAVMLCESWVDALCGGALPQLLQPGRRRSP
ncbi:MAG: transcriptional regulator BetI [Gammaproteobacteria bacterium]|nr:transcriptional regulator BetI [Gammaproteobacteria bacterium]